MFDRPENGKKFPVKVTRKENYFFLFFSYFLSYFSPRFFPRKKILQSSAHYMDESNHDEIFDTFNSSGRNPIPEIEFIHESDERWQKIEFVWRSLSSILKFWKFFFDSFYPHLNRKTIVKNWVTSFRSLFTSIIVSQLHQNCIKNVCISFTYSLLRSKYSKIKFIVFYSVPALVLVLFWLQFYSVLVLSLFPTLFYHIHSVNDYS